MKRLLLAGLLGLNAFTFSAHANEGNAAGPRQQNPIASVKAPTGKKVEISGKLQYVIRQWHSHELIMISDKLPQAISRSWAIGYGVTVGGKTIDVQFAGNVNHMLVERLCGRQVTIAGRDEGDKILAERLSGLPSDGDAITTIKVRGFLDILVLEKFPALNVYVIRAEGKTYHLDFASKDLRTQAEHFGSRRVLLEGTLKGDRINVSELKADETFAATEKVVIRGKLSWYDPHPDQPHFAIHPPIHGAWQIEVNGRKFNLALTREQRTQAWQMNGRDVRITGIVENRTVKVSYLEEIPQDLQWKVELLGVLTWINVAPDIRKLFEEDRFPVAMQWMVFGNDKSYTLRFESTELENRAKSLINNPVIVSGDFDGNFVTVRKIEADETTSIDQTTTIEVVGTLSQTFRPKRCLHLEMEPANAGRVVWVLECDGKSYELNLSEALAAKGLKLLNQMVVIKGRLNGNTITVDDLVSASSV